MKAWIAGLTIVALLLGATVVQAHHDDATSTSIDPVDGTVITQVQTVITATFTFPQDCDIEEDEDTHPSVEAVASSGAIVQDSLTCDEDTTTFTYVGTWSGYDECGDETVTLMFQQGPWSAQNHERNAEVSADYTIDIDCGNGGGALPTDKDECKKDGWEQFGVFKNQGDCVSYIATDGKNPPANE